MKVVFTDIDGVLNSAYYSKSHGGLSVIEERKVKNLKKIITAANAKVVVISKANALFGKDFDKERINAIKEYGVDPVDSLIDLSFLESKASRQALKTYHHILTLIQIRAS